MPSFTDRSPTTTRLEYLESSRDATTGEIRFRRHMQLVSRTDLAHGGWDGDPFVTSSSAAALPMAMAMGGRPAPGHPRAMNVNGCGHRYVERFQACEIGLEQGGHGSAGSSEARMMRIDPDLVL